MNQHDSWYPVENSRGFFTRPIWKNERKKGIYCTVCIFHMQWLFFSPQIFISLFFKLEISKSTNWKTASKTHYYQAKIIAYLCRYFRFFLLCCLYSTLCFFCRYVAFNKVCVILFSISFNRWWSWLQIDLEKKSMFY